MPRAGVGIGGSDVYLNVAGGLKIAEPAADLAAAAALVSSFGGDALPRDCVFFGEISLSGDVRPVPQAELRLKEAAKLGFKQAVRAGGTTGRWRRPEINRNFQCRGFAEFRAAQPRPKAASRDRTQIMNLSFNLVDFLVVLVIVVSAGYAVWRGFRLRDLVDLRLGRRRVRHALFRPLGWCRWRAA